jgi:hypothetical protein
VLLNTRRKLSCLFEVGVFAWPNKHSNPKKKLSPSFRINVPIHIYNKMFLSLPLYCKFKRYISPSTRDEILRNRYPLTSVNIHAFLAETAIPARPTKTRTALYNRREKFCIFITFMVHEVRNLFMQHWSTKFNFFFLSHELQYMNLAVLFMPNSDIYTKFFYRAGFQRYKEI